ncbi:MAG: ribosomal protection-like ABC-F family protein [Sporolactobacillus sp.]
MIICQADHIKKNIAGKEVLTDVSFSLPEDGKAALVGANGSGKSSLLRIIARKDRADSGALAISRKATVGLLEQLPQFGKDTLREVLRRVFSACHQLSEKMRRLEAEFAQSEPKVLERKLARYAELQEQFQRMGGYEIDYRVEQVAGGLGILTLLDKPADVLSGGEQTKAELARQLLTAPDFLLLDEPTNHLDIFALEWLEQFIRNYKGAVLLVSHDRFFLDRIATKVLDLEDGIITEYTGNYSAYVKEKQQRQLAAFAAYNDQQKKIKKMKETIKRLKEWANQANPPNAGLHRRAKSMEKALERIDRLKKPKMENETAALSFETNKRAGDRICQASELSVKAGGKTLFQNLTLEIRLHDRVAIMGPNGSGKTTLLQCLLGKRKQEAGEVRLGTNLSIGFLTQHEFQTPEEEKTRLIDVFREHAYLTEAEARHELAKFLFYGADVFRKIGTLSGGERVRLRIAELMQRQVNFLVLDEPTNHLDIDSREVLEDALIAFRGTVLAVSHDRYFIQKCFTRIYWLEKGKLRESSLPD